MAEEERSLTEAEVALMDTLKLVFEVFIAKGISKPDTLAEAMKRQIDQYPADTMPTARWVVGRLRATLLDPQRKEVRAFLDRPAEGNA